MHEDYVERITWCEIIEAREGYKAALDFWLQRLEDDEEREKRRGA